MIPTSEKAVVFGATHPIEAMFYIDHSIYGSTPDSTQVAALQKQGHAVYHLKEDSAGGLVVVRK